MVKDRSIAKGSWFYANPAAPKIDTTGKTPEQIEKAIDAAVDSSGHYDYPFPFPASGVALGTCQRCHASAANEMILARWTTSWASRVSRSGSERRTWRNPDLLSVLPRKLTSLFAAAAGRSPDGLATASAPPSRGDAGRTDSATTWSCSATSCRAATGRRHGR